MGGRKLAVAVDNITEAVTVTMELTATLYKMLACPAIIAASLQMRGNVEDTWRIDRTNGAHCIAQRHMPRHV